MRDFPPEISTFYSAPGEKPGPAPDTRTPAALLRWFLRLQWRLILLTTAVGVLWQLPLTLGPWMFGKAIDDGIVPGSVDQTLKWAGLLLLVTLIGAFFGIVMHTLIVRSWLIALYGTMKMVTRKVVQMGHVLPRRTPTGEVLSVAAADSDEFGALTEIVSRSGSQLISYLVVAFIVLSTSPELGVLMLIAAPILVGAALPAAASAAPPAADRAHAQLRPHLDGDRHRGRPADPARHRRRADLRPQLRPPVAARPPGRGLRRHLAGRHRGRRRAVLRRLHRAAGLARHPSGDLRRPGDRPADQLPGLRAVHDLPDPDLLRARAEGHPGHGLGPQGGGDLRGAAALARQGREHPAPAPRRPLRRAHRLRGAPRSS